MAYGNFRIVNKSLMKGERSMNNGEKTMKKHYEEPVAEKVEFDYSDNVTASKGETYNDDPNGQYFKCTCTTYYADGWGQNC